MQCTNNSRGLISFLFIALLTYSCGSDEKSKDTGSTLNFARVYTEVMSSSGTGLNCSVCHAPGGEATSDYDVTFNLTSVTTAEAGIKNGTVVSSGTPDCNGAKYVAANDPNGSYLYAVMGGVSTADFTGKAGCTPTNRHYAGSTALGISAAQKTLIKDWIEAGAP